MDMGSLEFLNMMDGFRDLWKTYLTLDRRAIDQKANMKLVSDKLVKEYPDVFQGGHGNKHLYFALRIIMRDHYRTRYFLNLSLERNPTPDSEFEFVKDEDEDVKFIPQHVLRSPTPAVSRKTTPDATVRSTPTVVALHSQTAMNPVARRTLAPRGNLNRPASSPDNGNPNINTASNPAPQSTNRISGVPAPSSSTGQPASCDEVVPINNEQCNSIAPENQGIHSFLATCKPPMTHYLKLFIDFGCTTETHLRSISLWLPEHKYNLVKTILKSANPGGATAEPTEMDVAFLVNQFEVYFVGK
ncbi:hypothetical protein BDN70DRAFT_932111 [Pholiota conissans]|uniref:Uncharacterized protein n=1 Tax=Pholiota conissans TaxID=109636 RepID=A0A9P5Z3I4_9AGAR|nr:hypothetical protein BDN70DRAFT_932111 [Pholiota conissans]